MRNPQDLEIGYDIPAAIGMAEAEIQTPCLIVDLDAFERNIDRLREHCERMGIAHRAHGKMHKSADVARVQIDRGGAVGICCQKVSEAEAFARAGIKDILVSNEVRDPVKIDRLARLPLIGARTLVCLDDIANVAELSAAAERHGTALECLVELEVGQGRCGVEDPAGVVAIARAVAEAPGLSFTGLQAYQGSMQHFARFEERQAAFERVAARVRETLDALGQAGFACETVTGGGTGSFELEAASGLYTELQCGSYAFMDADYGRVLDREGRRLDRGTWENALFLLTSVMSTARPGRAVCDAGLKSQSVDSGLPVIFGRDDVKYVGCSDEHGVIEDPGDVLMVNERLWLVPGHCDPTCNLHDWYVGVRAGVVETVWPVTARGRAY